MIFMSFNSDPHEMALRYLRDTLRETLTAVEAELDCTSTTTTANARIGKLSSLRNFLDDTGTGYLLSRHLPDSRGRKNYGPHGSYHATRTGLATMELSRQQQEKNAQFEAFVSGADGASKASPTAAKSPLEQHLDQLMAL